jgi:hypothetical protein
VDGELSAQCFITQLEREAALIGMDKSQLMEVIPFVLRTSALSWYRSNGEKLSRYRQFKKKFLKYYQSENLMYSSLTRLRTLPFNPKVDRSVQDFITERFHRIRELDRLASDVQICHGLIPLLPIGYQRQLATVRITKLMDMLEVVQRLEFVHDNSESRKGRLGDDEHTKKKFHVNEVEVERQDVPSSTSWDQCQTRTEPYVNQNGKTRQEWRKKPYKKWNNWNRKRGNGRNNFVGSHGGNGINHERDVHASSNDRWEGDDATYHSPAPAKN